jgi:hypothetical protein
MEEVENEGAYTNDEKRRNLADSEQISTIHDNRTRTKKTSKVMVMELGESADSIRAKLSYIRKNMI